MEEGRPNAQLLVDRGLVTRTGGVLALTPAGTRDRRPALRRAEQTWLERPAGRLGHPSSTPSSSTCSHKLSRALLGEDADRHLADR